MPYKKELPWLVTAGAYDHGGHAMRAAAAFIKKPMLGGDEVHINNIDLLTCQVAMPEPLPEALADRFALQFGAEAALQYGAAHVMLWPKMSMAAQYAAKDVSHNRMPFRDGARLVLGALEPREGQKLLEIRSMLLAHISRY